VPASLFNNASPNEPATGPLKNDGGKTFQATKPLERQSSGPALKRFSILTSFCQTYTYK
jgi:hypothetical protein